MFIKHKLNEKFKAVNITKKGQNADAVPSLHALIHSKYHGESFLSLKKISDLRKLLPLIPLKHQEFYEQILKEGGTADSEDVEEI